MLQLQRHDAERHSAPTAPKVSREMKPPSNRANQVRQKAAYVAWSVRVCFTARILISVLSSSIDFAPMSNLMNHNNFFVVENLENDTVIAYTELV